MAIRVLPRTLIRCLTSTPQQISTVLNTKPQSFSTNSPVPIPISPGSSEQSQYRKQISVAAVFQRYGLSKPQLHNFLTKNHFLLNSNLSEIETSLGILLSFEIPQNYLVSLIFDCPRVLEFEFLKKWELGFLELKNLSVTPLMIRKFLEHSRNFEVDPDRFCMGVKVLKGLGFSDSTVSRILEEVPRVSLMNDGEIRQQIGFLMEIGIGKDSIDRVLNLFPGILAFGTDNRLMTLLGEFRKLGFSGNVVKREVAREPRILGMELGELSRCLEFLRTLKCREPIKEKILSMGLFRAGYEVKLRIDCLCGHGLIRRDAFKVLWKEPRLIIYDVENIEKKIEFLVHTMELDVNCLVDVPEYLGVNFKKQIVPRYKVIEYLRSKGGLGCEVGLRELIKPSRLKFYNLYVKPYPDCEKMFGGKSRDIRDCNSRHPVGMWKLFQPQRYQESKEDEKNMKTFMETLQ